MAIETEGRELDRRVLTSAIEKILKDQQDTGGKSTLGIYLIALAPDQTPAGGLKLTFEMSPTVGGLIYMIQDVFVQADQRKKGIFRKLYEKAEQLAREDDMCKALRLYVETENYNAQKVYQRMGMSQVDYSFTGSDYIFTKA